MQKLPKIVNELIESFSRLPGIGPKSASRIVFHLLYAREQEVVTMSSLLKQLRTDIGFCKICHNLADKTEAICGVCSDTDRNQSEIMIVEDVLDLFAFERTGDYTGLYHVLGGVISPVSGIGPEDINIESLLKRLQKLSGKIELIVATNPTLEGEATGMYIKQELAANPLITITRIARGVPTGADLDYADRLTLKRALSGRNSF